MISPADDEAGLTNIARKCAAKRRLSAREMMDELLGAFWRGELERLGLDKPKLGVPAVQRCRATKIEETGEITLERLPGIPCSDDEEFPSQTWFDPDGLFVAACSFESIRPVTRRDVLLRVGGEAPESILHAIGGPENDAL